MLVGEAEVTISIKDIRNLKGGHLIGCLQDYNFEAQLYALATGSEDAERKILHELLLTIEALRKELDKNWNVSLPSVGSSKGKFNYDSSSTKNSTFKEVDSSVTGEKSEISTPRAGVKVIKFARLSPRVTIVQNMFKCPGCPKFIQMVENFEKAYEGKTLTNFTTS